MRTSILSLIFFLSTHFIFGQTASLEGYVFESGNRGFLNNILIQVLDERMDTLITSTNSNDEGFFSCEVPLDQKFTIHATHDYFHSYSFASSSIGTAAGEKIFHKMEMKRAPGYLFEITMAEERPEGDDSPVDAIKNSRIEVYNNTEKEMVLLLDDYNQPDFKVHLKKGNHYTLMIRKTGYITKRMEAFVDVKGCILCFEGIGEVRPGVTDNLTEKNSFGTLLANVELEKVYPGKEIKVNTIYYEPASFALSDAAKMELDKLGVFMTDNPDLLIELGSHTDSRGNEVANTELSQKRAQTAVDYVISSSEVGAERLMAKGYGFSQILNHCKSGVKCSSEEHAVNRRTELKLVGVLGDGQFFEKSLASMKQLEHMDELLAEIQNEGTIEVPSDGELPKEDRTSKKDVTKINKEFEDKSKDINASVKETVAQIVKEERNLEDIIQDEIAEEVIDNSSASVNVNEEAFEIEELATEEEIDEEEIDDPAILEEPKSDKAQAQGNSTDWMQGFKIVVQESKDKLTSDHEIFEEFKMVKSLMSPVSKKHLYMVGKFETEQEAQKFLEDNLRVKYPQAYIIGF